MVRNIVGSVPRGDDFYDREELVALAWERLEAGNVLLAGPRRFGKTSLMYRLIDNPRPGWKAVHIDAESIREPANFILALLDALMRDRHLRDFLVSALKKGFKGLKDLLPEVEVATPWDVTLKIKFKEAIRAHWQEQGEALLRTLRAYDAATKIVLIIDELPVMLSLFRDNDVSDEETRAFLYWFRKLRTDPNVGLTNCRFLVGGSIGIENYLSRLDAVDSFNDFERLYIGELTRDTADSFLALLLKSRKLSLSAATRRRILELVGVPIPYFVQIFVAEIAGENTRGSSRIGPKAVEAIYQQGVLSASCKTYFQHYYDRLRHYDKPQERAAKALLKELALASPNAVGAAQLRATYRTVLGEQATGEGFAQLVGDLENDFCIRYVPEGDTYVFASKILCDWWRRYYAF